MRCKRIVATIAVGVLLAAGSLTTAAGATTTSSSPRCLSSHWPAWTEGRPIGVDPATAAGVYMWHDATGWHIRAKQANTGHSVFRGQLVTAGRFVAVSPVRLEHRDVVTVSRDRRVVRFRFDNHGHVDGINFRTLCAPSISFSFGFDGARVSPDQVTIGHDGGHPTSVPFTITRN